MKRFLITCFLIFCFTRSFAQSFQIVFLTDPPLIVDAKEYEEGDIVDVFEKSVLHLKKEQAVRLQNISTGEQYPLYNATNRIQTTELQPWINTHGMYIRGEAATDDLQYPSAVFLDTLSFRIEYPSQDMKLLYQTNTGKNKSVRIKADKNHFVNVSRKDLPGLPIGRNLFIVKKGGKELASFPVVVPKITVSSH